MVGGPVRMSVTIDGVRPSTVIGDGRGRRRATSPRSPRRRPRRNATPRARRETRRQQSPQASSDQEGLPVLLAASSSRHLARLQSLLTRSGYRVFPAISGLEALRVLEREAIALVLLQHVHDMTPDALCERVKTRIAQHQLDLIPVILLAERFDPDEVVRCFHAGADDCVTGPHLESRVLLARIQTALRSCSGRAALELPIQEERITIGNIVIDRLKFRVYFENRPLDLTRIQFHLLYAMARRPGWIFSHAQLRGTIARQGGSPDEKSVKSHISHLRRRLGPAARHIQTVRGIGYRFCE